MKKCLIFYLITSAFFSIIRPLSADTKPENDLLMKQTIRTQEILVKEQSNNLDSYYSAKQLGVIANESNTIFRIFVPSAEKVFVEIFDSPEQEAGKIYELNKDENAVWEIKLEAQLFGKYYGYKVQHSKDLEDLSQLPLCVDPYAKAVTSYTSYYNPRKAIISKDDEFDWEGDKWIERDWRDLIIYEMHVRDMTAHSSSGSSAPGTYTGLIEKGNTGGIDYIKELGINTVELLPAMEFGNCEIPYKDSLGGKYNTWNPYERNHWGYMTSNFFAPSAYYSENWNQLQWNTWMGKEGKQVTAFKEMVKAFHKEGIAVIMDVVYNHLSEYEIGNLKQIDKDYYFRLDEAGNYIAESYCGNDIKTERPMMRRLIIDSILYWMKEYHIDGFRFDLAKLLDWITIEEIIREARKINPNVVFVCEPWGGGYDPKGFSLREWGAWNDQIRNGIKGENPFNGLGWIFGKWYGNNDINRIKSYVNGTLVNYEHGLFRQKEHSVNYLASHDGYTLGDFIRLGTGEVNKDQIIENIDNNAKLSKRQTKLNKLASMFLLTSQGITMIHSGQEFARSKVIPKDANPNDKHCGMIDHNTYDKDNEVNYINYDHAKLNSDLFEYYQGLINLRKKYAAFRHASPEQIEFYEDKNNQFFLGYKLEFDDKIFVVLFNANQLNDQNFVLPEGEWSILANEKSAGTVELASIEGKVTIPSTSGIILQKK